MNDDLPIDLTTPDALTPEERAERLITEAAERRAYERELARQAGWR